MSEEEQENQSTSVAVPIDWHIPDNIITPYASNMFVQAGEYEMILTFFQAKMPLLTGTPEENKTKLEQLDAIKAECVSRIIVPPDLIPNIIKALRDNLGCV